MDFSTAYFSLNGSEPALLPRRLRVGPGSTRYVNDVSIEELNALGYIGPVDKKPDIPSEALFDYCWISDTLSYVKVEFESNEDKFKNEWVYSKDNQVTEKRPKDPAALVTLENQTWSFIRAKRDSLLKATDWTQLDDVNYFIKQAFRVYRQDLRDIPNKFEAWEVVFPPMPSTQISDLSPTGFVGPIDEFKTGYFVYDPNTGQIVLDTLLNDLSDSNNPL